MIPHSQKLNQCEYVIINRAVVTVYYLQSKTNLNYDQILLNVKYKLFLFPVFCMSKLFSLFSFKKKKEKSRNVGEPISNEIISIKCGKGSLLLYTLYAYKIKSLTL